MSLVLKFKCSKVKLEMTLAEPLDAVLRNAGPSLGGAQIETLKEAVKYAKSAL